MEGVALSSGHYFFAFNPSLTEIAVQIQQAPIVGHVT